MKAARPARNSCADGQRVAKAALIAVTLALVFSFACGGGDEAVPTIDPDPPLTESAAIEIAKASLAEVIEDIEFAGYDRIRVRTGAMRLRRLQELTKSNLYTPDSPRMQRQIWAIQIGGKFDDDPDPYSVPYGYGIVGVDAINGDIWLRARYDTEILVVP